MTSPPAQGPGPSGERWVARDVVWFAAAIGIAGLVRLVFLAGVPEIWTLDSRSYLRIALKIARDGSFDDAQLGVLRLPGYPLFLAGVQGLLGRSADALLGAQAAVGLLATAAAFALGRSVTGSRRAGLALGLLFAIGPWAIGFEHALMSEALATALLVLASLLLFRVGEAPERLGLAAAAGATTAAGVLVRLNGALFLAVVGGLLLFRAAWRRRPLSWRAPAAAAAVLLAALGLCLAPWIAHNARKTGRASLFASPAKVALVYAIQHGAVDAASLPVNSGGDGSALAGDPGLVTFWRMLEAAGPVGSERMASESLAVARAQRRQAFAAARRAALRRWCGVPVGGELPDAVRWLDGLTAPDPRLDHARRTGRRFLEPRSSPPDARLLASLRTGLVFNFGFVRPALLAAGALGLLAIVSRLLRRRSVPADTVALTFGTAYLATLVLHVGVLADYERFATTFDWVPLLIAVQAVLPVRAPESGGGGAA